MKRVFFFVMLAAASGVLAALVGCVVENDDGSEGQVVISAECNWYGGVECEVACTDFSFDLACEGEVEIECEPECESFEIDVECSGSCFADCGAECEYEPGEFDCEAYCEGECSANCEGECSASSDEAYCEGECQSYCEGHCSASCDIEAPDLDCDAWCDASCEGECSAEADIDCHLCDVEANLDCSADLEIDCQAGCDADGVLECNGEFIDRQDLESAIDWVRDNMTAEVTFEGDAECAGNACSAEGSCAFECAAARTDGKGAAAGLGLFLLGIASFFLVRRRDR